MGPSFVRQSEAIRRGTESTSRRNSPEEIFSHAACITVHNFENVAGEGFCARTVELSRMFLEPITHDFGPVTWRIVMLENSFIVCVHGVHGGLQMAS